MDNKQISVREAFVFARKTYKNHYKLLIASMLTFFVSWVLLEVIVIAGEKLGFALWFIAHLAFFFVFAGLEAGFVQMSLVLVDGQEISYSSLFANLTSGWRFFLGQLLYLVICLVGLIFLVIPGFYWGTRYSMSGFCLVTKSTNPAISLRESVEISKNSLFSIFKLNIVITLLNLLGASFLGIGLLISVPISVLMKASAFRQLESYSIS